MATISIKRKQQRHIAGEVSVDAVQIGLVPYYWDFIEHYVKAALEYANGELQAEDVKQQLMAGQMRLFVVKRPYIVGAATCEVVRYSRKQAVRVVTLGGEDFEAWARPLHEALRDWARQIGAAGIEAYVRRGLVEKLEALGYSQTYVGMWYGEKLGQDSDR